MIKVFILTSLDIKSSKPWNVFVEYARFIYAINRFVFEKKIKVLSAFFKCLFSDSKSCHFRKIIVFLNSLTRISIINGYIIEQEKIYW